jgi:exodeoxyribonuclease VII large subunit
MRTFVWIGQANMTKFDPPDSATKLSNSAQNSPEFGAEISEPVPISALVRNVRDLLEHRFRLVWVTGEVSNLTPARSGHWYFVLKDATAQVRCVMFRNRNLYLDWAPKEGMQIEARALVTLYEARGEFQLNVEFMRQAGRGSLYEAFVILRDKLQAEGLFDASQKRALPAYPHTIGIVTSPHAAALRDIISTIRHRNPSIALIVYPTAVQGERAAREIVSAIGRAAARKECDVLIVARGGGSIEDLWCFNDEAVARAIRACPIPVIAGVGHETDFTIADFAADVRAPTPTGAAALASSSSSELRARIRDITQRLTTRMRRHIERHMQSLDYHQRSLSRPGRRIGEERVRVIQLVARLRRSLRESTDRDRRALTAMARTLAALLPDVSSARTLTRHQFNRLHRAIEQTISAQRATVAQRAMSLHHLDPMAVLARGYSITRDAAGNVITNAKLVVSGQAVEVTLASGSIEARVFIVKP